MMSVYEIHAADTENLLRIARLSRKRSQDWALANIPEDLLDQYKPRTASDEEEADFIAVDLRHHPDEHLLVAEVDGIIVAYVHVGIYGTGADRQIQHAEPPYVDCTSPQSETAYKSLLGMVEDIAHAADVKSISLYASTDDLPANIALVESGYIARTTQYQKILL